MDTKRESLLIDTLYFDMGAGMYFWTPDKVGVFWMDESEAGQEFGLPLEFRSIHSLED